MTPLMNQVAFTSLIVIVIIAMLNVIGLLITFLYQIWSK
jgi:hypothetical protein